MNIITKENIGAKIRFKSWEKHEYCTLVAVTKNNFTLEYNFPKRKGPTTYDMSSADLPDMEILNSSVIRQRLGIK